MDTSFVDISFLILLLVIGIQVSLSAESPQHHEPRIKEYCQWETFNATCKDDEVIIMQVARYGRMRTGRCVTKSYGSLGCVINVLPYIDSLCSGRHSCQVVVPDENLRSLSPCDIKELAAYLEASYTCVPVHTGEGSSCYTSGRLEIPAVHGYLSSVLTGSTGRGTGQCPWILSASPGQRINITLHDFSAVRQFTKHGKLAEKHANEIDETLRHTYCRNYADIRETQATRATVVCGGEERKRVVYISATNQVEIHINGKITSPKHTSHFLLEYTAVGCPTLSSPSGGWIERTGDNTMVLGCNNTREKSYRQCHGDRWTGNNITCTAHPETAESIWNVLSDDWSSPFGILIVSALGVALGLVIGIALLSIVLVVIKKRKDSCLVGEPDYEMTAQDSDDNAGHYVTHAQNKRNSATLLMGDQMEMQTIDPATYGAITWRSRPPSYSTEPGDRPSTRSTGPATPRLASRSDTLPRAAELSRSHAGCHVYESPKFIRREGSLHGTLEIDAV